MSRRAGYAALARRICLGHEQMKLLARRQRLSISIIMLNPRFDSIEIDDLLWVAEAFYTDGPGVGRYAIDDRAWYAPPILPALSRANIRGGIVRAWPAHSMPSDISRFVLQVARWSVREDSTTIHCDVVVKPQRKAA